jgi:hypothetical protein
MKSIFCLALVLSSSAAFARVCSDDVVETQALAMGEQNGVHCQVTSHRSVTASETRETREVGMSCDRYLRVATLTYDIVDGQCIIASARIK